MNTTGIAGRGQTPAQQLIASGYTPTDSELEALCTYLHSKVIDKPLMLWMDRSFEDQADSVTRAIECAQREESEIEFNEMRRAA